MIAVLTGVSMIHSLRMWQQSSNVKRSPLFRVFVRDGLLYLIVITITKYVCFCSQQLRLPRLMNRYSNSTANVVFFVQKDVALKGSAMAFQFLFSSLMSCRLVLSLRDSEATVFQHAAASLVSRSFWKSGTGAMDAETGGSNHVGGGGAQSYQLKLQRSNSSMPTYNMPISPLEVRSAFPILGSGHEAEHLLSIESLLKLRGSRLTRIPSPSPIQLASDQLVWEDKAICEISSEIRLYERSLSWTDPPRRRQSRF